MDDDAQANRLKRLHMRSMRRGIKEMDLILSAYAVARLDQMDEAELALYENMLNEIDHDLYQWVSGQAVAPEHYGPLIADIQTHLARTPAGT